MSIEQESTGTEPTSAALLDAALLVIGERGVKGATTRLIAERAGVNEVTLFRKFGTRSQLIRAAIENRFAAVRDEYVGHTGDLQHDLARRQARVAQQGLEEAALLAAEGQQGLGAVRLLARSGMGLSRHQRQREKPVLLLQR